MRTFKKHLLFAVSTKGGVSPEKRSLKFTASSQPTSTWITENVEEVTFDPIHGTGVLLLRDNVTTLAGASSVVGSNLFSDTGSDSNVTAIEIPPVVSRIDATAFKSCSAITSVKCVATRPPVVVEGAFKGIGTDECVVPLDLVFEYVKSDDWYGEFNYIMPDEFPTDKILFIASAKPNSSWISSNTSKVEFNSSTGKGSMTLKNATTSLSGTSSQSHQGSAFNYYQDSNITAVILPTQITEVTVFAFYNMKKLRAAILPESILSFGECIFGSDTDLKSLKLPANANLTANRLVAGCSALKAIKFPAVLTSIPQATCDSCTSLKEVVIPSLVTEIVWGAFKGCSSLKSVTFPNTLSVINEYSFSGCAELEFTALPPSLTTIKTGAFSGCKIKSLSIPTSTTSISDSAFGGCDIDYVSVDPNNTVYNDNSGSNAVYETSTGDLVIGSNNTNPVLPVTATKIRQYAFNHRTHISTITLPSTITSVDAYAFNKCDALLSVVSLAQNPPAYGPTNFTAENDTLYVPHGRLSAYINAYHNKFWQLFSNVEELPE